MTSPYKSVVLTGPDGLGKQTHSVLLCYAIPNSVRLEFPDYDHWSGELIRTFTRDEQFALVTESGEGRAAFPDRNAPTYPYIYQSLHAINKLQAAENIRLLKERHHLVLDRYDLDLYLYGVAKGCSRAWCLSQLGLFEPTDLTIGLIGESYRKAGQDLDEGDATLQDRVRAELIDFASTKRRNLHLLDVRGLGGNTPLEQTHRVHTQLCQMVEHFLAIEVEPLSFSELRTVAREAGSDGDSALDPNRLPLVFVRYGRVPA